MSIVKILWLSLVFLCGCDSIVNDHGGVGKSCKVKVLSTTAMVGYLVAEVGGDGIEHEVLILGDIDPHSYELVKGDAEKILDSDILVFSGLGLEQGASLRKQIDSHPRTLGLGTKLYSDYKDKFLFVNGQIDPHFWLDLSLFAKSIPYIVDELSNIDPIHAHAFEERGKLLYEKLMKLDLDIMQRIHEIPDQNRYMIASHDGFRYFISRYFLNPFETCSERFIAPEGFAKDGQISVVNIKNTFDFLTEKDIHVVFSEFDVSKAALEKIIKMGKSKGFMVVMSDGSLYADTMGQHKDFSVVIKHNADVVVRNLKG